MQTGNWTILTEFILLGLTEDPALQVPLFVFFLLVYIITLQCNIGIIVLVWLNHHLRTPMYFFLCCLSFVEAAVSSVTVPKMLVDFLSKRKAISFAGCAMQMFSSFLIGGSEVQILAVMSYDRYTAICKPLLYPVIMNSRVCLSLVGAVVGINLVNALFHAFLTFTLPFCGSNVITHYACDVPPVLKIACTDTRLNELLLVVVVGGMIVASVSIILVSYGFIIAAIIKINSSDGRRRAISTCSSHFVSVSMFYGTLIFMYATPSSGLSMTRDRVVSVFYMVIIPMLNPLIWSLRNQEIKQALRKSIRRCRGAR
ncbi:olfactory receptor 5T17-like [Pleurodeles waltl]|uniref:olfactory receptor 5T17-like n=1 Tax=Pleurodeles waltl TaxID=8319 RepID=UPI0037097FA7